MKPIPAIVEPAQIDVARLEQQIITALADEQNIERTITRVRGQLDAAIETARLRRLEIGRYLVKVRAAWPKSGPKAKGWSEFLARVKLDDSTAVRYMEAARTSPVHGEPPKITGKDSAHVGNLSQNPESDEGQLLARLAQLDPDARGRIMRSLRSSQARENAGDRDAYCTPEAISRALPEVDFDPCSNPRSTVRARRTYSLEAGTDGLAAEWSGSGYFNVPFSDPRTWAEKFERERAAITAAGWMGNEDHSTGWWHILKRTMPLRLDFDERLEFAPPPGVETSKNDRPQTLLMDEAFWAMCDQEALLKLGTLWRQDPKGGDVSLDEPA